MVGIARKNENSAAERLSAPSSIPETMVVPERETPGIIARHCASPMIRYIAERELRRVVMARLQVERIDPQQDRAADDQREADHPGVEQHVLDEAVPGRADDRRRQERDQHADDKTARGGIGEHAERDLP